MKFNRQPNFTHCYNVKFIAVINWSDYNKDFTTTKKKLFNIILLSIIKAK